MQIACTMHNIHIIWFTSISNLMVSLVYPLVHISHLYTEIYLGIRIVMDINGLLKQFCIFPIRTNGRMQMVQAPAQNRICRSKIERDECLPENSWNIHNLNYKLMSNYFMFLRVTSRFSPCLMHSRRNSNGIAIRNGLRGMQIWICRKTIWQNR